MKIKEFMKKNNGALVNYVKSRQINNGATDYNKNNQNMGYSNKGPDIEDRKNNEIIRLQPARIDTPDGQVANVFRPLIGNQVARAIMAIKPLLEKGYIEEMRAPSEWLTPIRLVKKADGSDRVCLDLRALNNLVKQDNYPIPNIATLLDPIRGMKYFTKLDIKDGFFQVSLEEEHRKKTGFKIGNKMYQFNVLPMGFRNSPNIFQRIMDYIFKELISKICIVYIDDILVFSSDESAHKKDVAQVLEILEKYNFKVNESKAVYRKQQLDFLGYNIKHNCITAQLDRVQGIRDFPTPKNLREVRRFIGILNYDRRFMKNISEILRPLYGLTQKGVKFNWNSQHEGAFEKAKKALMEAAQLTIPDAHARFALETDASNTGMGAVLRQDDGVIGYASATLTLTQQKYTITERELLAALWAMNKFKHYLIGKEFDLITDHEAIKAYKNKMDFGNTRIQRWYEALEVFQFVPKYRPGEEMIISDALSRSLEAQHIIEEKGMEFEGSASINYYVTSEESDAHKDNQELEIMKLHEILNHRKDIQEDLKEKGINCSKKIIKNILENCLICLERDNKHIYSNRYVETENPGEKVGIDLLQIKRTYIVVLIYYYSRKDYGRYYRQSIHRKL